MPGPQTEFEADYIYNFCLADIENLSQNRRVLVYSSNRREKQLDDVKHNDVIIHLSNENLKYSYSFLTKHNIILRSYYNPFIRHSKCYSIPLGWQTGYANKKHIKGNHDRYIWSFIGQIKGYRKPMYEAFRTLYPSYTSVSNQWNSKTLTDKEVQEVYLDSAFALVPFGSIHADTMRVMEVLEWGCIPVVIKYMYEDYYKYIYGDHPFIVANNWDDARKIVENLWYDKVALLKKQEEVSVWYMEYKKNLQADIRDILCDKRPSRCKQWKYQKIGRINLWMLLTWYYHFYYKNPPIY